MYFSITLLACCASKHVFTFSWTTHTITGERIHKIITHILKKKKKRLSFGRQVYEQCKLKLYCYYYESTNIYIMGNNNYY